jgi:hypothetical protein
MSIHQRWNAAPSWMHRGAALSTVLLGVLACSSVEPRSGLTLRVWNLSCYAGQCSPLHILGFPDNQPATPGGGWKIDLGSVQAPITCLTIPPSSVFRIIGLHSDGTADTTAITWTPAIPLSLGTVAADGNYIMAAPSTSEFTPAAARGWALTLPAGNQVTPAEPCGP